MNPELQKRVQFTQRIKPDSYYTDGERLVEIYRVYPLGHVHMRDVRTNEILGASIAVFRRDWWLVK